jgi:hypothetical protein
MRPPPQVAVEGQRPPLPEVLPSCPPAIRQLITACWADDPHKRPSSRELLELSTQLLLEHEAQQPGAQAQGQGQAPEGQAEGLALAVLETS